MTVTSCRSRTTSQKTIAMSQVSQISSTTERTARRVRHETKTRLLQVREVSRISPKMVRIVVGGEALTGFVSAAHDDHVKLFFAHLGRRKAGAPDPSPADRSIRKARCGPWAGLHPAPLRRRGEYVDDRFRPAWRWSRCKLGGAGASRKLPGRRRSARVVHSARRFRLVPFCRGRNDCRRSGVGWRSCRQVRARSSSLKWRTPRKSNVSPRVRASKPIGFIATAPQPATDRSC